MYVIHKQLIPIDTNMGDPNWAKRQVWVLKLNSNDTLDEFEDLESAEEKKNELTNSDPTGRIYKISIKNEDGSLIEF